MCIRWDFGKKPLGRFTPRRIARLKRPLKKTLKKVDDFLRLPNRLVMFFDEGRFGLKPVVGRLWAKKGRPTKVVVKPGYKNFYLYSAVSPHAGESFTLFLPWVNTDMMNFYLEHLSENYHDKELMLIMDQAGWHKSKDLKEFDNIRIEYLPPYSPELNPVERLWKWFREAVQKNRIFDSLETLMDKLTEQYTLLTKKKLMSLCKCNYL